MPQRRNRRAGVEDLWHKRDGSPTKLHSDGPCPPNRRCDGVGKRWRARYVNSAGQERTKVFATKPEAQRFLDGMTTSMETGTYVDPGRSKTTVGAIAETWIETPSWAESTRARSRSILDAHVLPRWGSVRLADVHHEDVQEWINGLGKAGMAGGTVRKVHGVLNGVLKAAIKGKRLAVNPSAEVDLPRQDLKRRRYLSGVEVEALVHAAGGRGPIVLVLAFCGLRFGELAALKAGAVDQVRRRLRIEESVTEVNGALVWSEPKDHQRRTVPWPKFLDAEISAAMKGKAPGDLLFPSPGGGALRVRNMRRDWFDAAAKGAGVGGLTPHELRHTAASLAVSAGASVLALQRMLGHDKPSTTLDVYSDLFDEDLDLVADRLAEGRSRSTAEYLRSVEASKSGLKAVPTS